MDSGMVGNGFLVGDAVEKNRQQVTLAISRCDLFIQQPNGFILMSMRCRT